jgi:hypothetical protein
VQSVISANISLFFPKEEFSHIENQLSATNSQCAGKKFYSEVELTDVREECFSNYTMQTINHNPSR